MAHMFAEPPVLTRHLGLSVCMAALTTWANAAMASLRSSGDMRASSALN